MTAVTSYTRIDNTKTLHLERKISFLYVSALLSKCCNNYRVEEPPETFKLITGYEFFKKDRL